MRIDGVVSKLKLSDNVDFGALTTVKTTTVNATTLHVGKPLSSLKVRSREAINVARVKTLTTRFSVKVNVIRLAYVSRNVKGVLLKAVW